MLGGVNRRNDENTLQSITGVGRGRTDQDDA